MNTTTATCEKCGKQFWILDKEQKFLQEKGFPSPTHCPACRQERRLSLRGGRALFKTKCQQCGKEIIVSYNPESVKNKILCREDYEKYFQENDPIITDPLPDA